MKTRNATSNIRPVELQQGPTKTLYRFDIRKTTQTDEETKEEHESYTYQEYAFDAGEYEAVRAGILPGGISWTTELRRIERSGMLDTADKYIMEAQDYIETSSGDTKEAWETYLSDLRAYKIGVRNTVDAENFPESVTYPEMPEQP